MDRVINDEADCNGVVYVQCVGSFVEYLVAGHSEADFVFGVFG
jgi:hypothetical protein